MGQKTSLDWFQVGLTFIENQISWKIIYEKMDHFLILCSNIEIMFKNIFLYNLSCYKKWVGI
jgi:hypothetical protein